MTDEEIISLYFDRSEEAIAATQRKYDGYCRAIVGRILGSARDTEEIISDTWLKAWLSIPPNRPRDLKLYLAKIGRNLALNRLRDGRAAKRGEAADAVLEELREVLGENTTEETVNAKELQTAVNRFLRQLPERECNIFVRRCFHAESAEEIAARYGLRPNTVTVSLHRTRKKLREYLVKEGYL
jgi:RNA polymerase sigma-70 factor (ECF subfamily)